MKKLVLFFIFLGSFYSFSQTQIASPASWHRSDYVNAGDSVWYDRSGNHQHAYPQDGHFPGETLFNYNPSFSFDGSIPAFRMPVPSASSDYTVMIAYQTSDTMQERGLWSFSADSSFIGISTQRLFGEYTVIRYNDTTRTDAIVNTITQSWKKNDFSPESLYIGGTDTLPFSGKLGEVVVFDHRIGGKDLLQWQSYLAVKHGITLYKLNYINSRGDTTWHYDLHPSYMGAISGLGCDTAFGLHQKQSLMADRMTIAVGEIALNNPANTSIIPEGNFLIWGIDSAFFEVPRTTYLQSGEEVLTYGNCLMDVTGDAIRTMPTSLQIDASGWTEVELNNCALLIDRNQSGDFSGSHVEIYAPVHIDTNGIITFSGIYWDTDYSGSDLFRIGFYPKYDQGDNTLRSATATNTGNNNPDIDAASSVNNQNLYNVYPNPSSGSYNLSISLSTASDVVVRMMSPEGKLLEIKEGKGQKEYRFTGNLSVKGHYLIEVESELESKTLQLIRN